MIEKLYEAYHGELVHWCTHMTDNPQTAEELVQEAFLRALQNEMLLNEMDERQGRAWLYRTTKNLFIDRIRRQGKETVTDTLPEQNNFSGEMSEVEWEALLRALPKPEGLLFYMRYVQGYTSTQLGQMFNLPPGTVRSKLSSAKNHLKQAIGGKKNV